MFPSSPNRPNCVNDEASRQTISASNFRFAGSTTAERAAFSEQFGACGAVNCAVDPATAEEGGVRRVHNGINVQLRDIALNDLDFVSCFLFKNPCNNDEAQMTNDERNPMTK